MAKQKSNAPKIAQKPTPQYKPTETAKQVPSSTFWDGYLPIIAVLVLTVLAFSPTFQSEFVNWDDDLNILKNKYLDGFTFANISSIFSTTVIGGYNPLSIFSFALEKAIFGVENLSLAIHTNNLLLHFVNVFFVWRIVGAMGFNRWSAFGVALLFGIHPMRVESVAWATERKDVLFGAFYFAAIYQYIKYLKSENYTLSNRHLVMAFGLFILSLFSKIQAVSLPLSMLALDYYFKRPLGIKLLFDKAHFFLGSLAYGLLSIYLLKNAQTITDENVLYSTFGRLVIGLHTYTVYVGKFVFPWIMSPLYPYPDVLPTEFYVSALLLVVSIVGIIWAFRRGMTNLVFGWVFFFVNYIFVSQIVAAGQGFLADRFTYVPYFGFFVILAAYTEGVLFNGFGDKLSHDSEKSTLANAQNEQSTAVKWVFMAYAVVCLLMTFQQTRVWNNSELLWTKALEYDDRASTAWQNRALYLRDKKNFSKALEDLNQAIVSSPKATAAYISRGKTYIDMGDAARALPDFSMALQLKPDLAEGWANRGSAYGQLGKLDSALVNLNEALRLDSTLTSAYLGRGNVYGITGRFEESVQDLTKAHKLNPKDEEVLLNRSITYLDMKQTDKALVDADNYLALKADNPKMWFHRATLKTQLGKYAEALTDFNEAIKLNSLDGGYYHLRALCHQKMGNLAAMRSDVQAARARGIQNFEAELLQ
ncbi:MAG: tetratricopeptide repeat protein [Saprospiraceae bacterium]|nr:tetratricopeptide repeat protein [Saprospiraceae bacterium]